MKSGARRILGPASPHRETDEPPACSFYRWSEWHGKQETENRQPTQRQTTVGSLDSLVCVELRIRRQRVMTQPEKVKTNGWLSWVIKRLWQCFGSLTRSQPHTDAHSWIRLITSEPTKNANLSQIRRLSLPPRGGLLVQSPTKKAPLRLGPGTAARCGRSRCLIAVNNTEYS